ncbi:MAG: SAM-dependent methyltransferase, partial [Bacteroidia bacterium]|nr:SAM-dependent methyltransferase [Bacteroidia bacterium]
FDLNPLAVITARVNYLLAILDLLPHRRGEIIIPVYLADSVRTPAEGSTLLSAGAYEFPTAAGTFEVPEELCKPERFDRFCSLVESCLHNGLDTKPFLQHLERQLSLVPPAWNDSDRARVQQFYETLLDLHRRGLNGIWARLLQNNFAPLTVGQFDYIVGNPPWINWEHLPDKYRQSLKPLWERYGLFPHGGIDTILGKGKKDIAQLMTYVVCDMLLKPQGKLGFIITQSVFKTAGAGEGFRRWEIPSPSGQAPTPLKVIEVHDLVELQPFEAASNRTAVIILQKGQPTTYPVPYILWRKGNTSFTPESSLSEVYEATQRYALTARPINPQEATSVWLTLSEDTTQAIQKVLGPSAYEAHAGAYSGGANAVYWLQVIDHRPDGLLIVQNITEGAKIKLPDVIEAVEPDLVYPLLRGRDIQRWRAVPSAHILMVQDPKTRRGIDEVLMQEKYPKTYGYLKRFEPVLRQRKSRGISDMLKKGAPFYTMFGVGDYTFAPWKVVWTRIAKIEAAVVSTREGKPVIPQETITLVACDYPEEAYYIAALVNSSLFQYAAVSYSQEGGKSMGSMHVLEHIRIPAFERNHPTHSRLAELSQEAHVAAEMGNEARLQKIEAEIDKAAAELWGLTPQELQAVQESLQELG